MHIQVIKNIYNREQQGGIIQWITYLHRKLVLKSLTYRKERPWYKNAFLFLARIAQFFTDYRSLVKKIDDLSRTYEYESSEFVAVCVMGEGISERTHSKYFVNLEKIEFEGLKMKVPVGRHEWLINVFGDYMQWPPVADRVSNHSFYAYWKTEMDTIASMHTKN